MQKVLPSGMRQKKESLYGTTQFGKNQVFNLLLRAWASQNHKTNWVQEKEKSRLNHQVCSYDWKVHWNLQNCCLPFQTYENYPHKVVHSNLWKQLKRRGGVKEASNHSANRWRFHQRNYYQTLKGQKDFRHCSQDWNRPENRRRKPAKQKINEEMPQQVRRFLAYNSKRRKCVIKLQKVRSNH